MIGFATAHPYWAAYIVLATAGSALIIAIGLLRPRRSTAAPDVSGLLAQADVNLADFAKTGRLRGPGGRFVSTKETTLAG